MNFLRLAASLFLLLTTANAFAVNPRYTTITKSASALNAGASLTLFSPCKINLFLRILRKREDGYHDLASLFQAVGFGDTLDLEILEGAQEDTFTCNMPGVPVDQTNLVLRALTLMRTKTGMETYFNANLFKECPAQAGLGGGSANAATAMFAANELMGNPATLDEVSQAMSSRESSVVWCG
jgi:4-diphosphocytidyl-2-C-methyl-D-erythritol kinase